MNDKNMVNPYFPGFLRTFLWMVFLAGIISITGCRSRDRGSEKEATPRVPVTVTTVHTGIMSDYLELNAVSSFFDKSVIKATITGYIVEMTINPGDHVSHGQVLYTLRTKESAALNNDSAGPFRFSGLVPVKAVISGVVTSVIHPKGDFVQEGDELGQIVIPSSLVFILEAPFDDNRFIRPGRNCEIILPDGTKLEALIKPPLPDMSGASQTQRYILKPLISEPLPENLIARVRIVREIIPRAEVLPKSCILSDEVMKEFWVMKLVNDSMAVKVPVRTGLVKGDSIQVTEPSFLSTDLILNSGNYGLGDTAIVQVIKKN
jgi:biotin carboxyl carrier protein